MTSRPPYPTAPTPAPATPEKRDGVVYTPGFIVELILDNALPKSADGLASAAICDPACGDGAFLTAAARRILSNLERREALSALRAMAGYDIDADAARKCEARLDAVLRERYPNERLSWNIAVRDALDRSAFEADRGRFTRVIGNPPYVRVQHLERERRERMAGQWRLLRGATDLYLIFYELALDLLRDGGAVGFIAPSSWLRSDSGSLLRETLVENHAVKKVIDFGERQVFDGVTTYTAIAIIEKGGATADIPLEFCDGDALAGGGSVLYDRAAPSRAWRLARSQADKERMDEMANRGARLRDVADIHVGVQTLADGVFIHPAERAADAGFERWILRDIMKASVMKGGADPVRRVVIFPYGADGKPLTERRIAEDAPIVYNWLRANKERLLSRDKGKLDPAKWYAFGRQVSIASGFGEKILTSGMNRKPNFQICANPDATFYSGYCVKPKPTLNIDLDSLLAVLNSDDMDFFIRHAGRPYQGGWRSYAKSFIQDFPIRANALTADFDKESS